MISNRRTDGPGASDPRLGWGAGLMALGALVLLGAGVLTLVRGLGPVVLEPGPGAAQVTVKSEYLAVLTPQLAGALSRLTAAGSTFMVVVSAALLILVGYGVRRGALWAWVGAVLTLALAMTAAVPIHSPTGPAALTLLAPHYAGGAITLVGAVLAAGPIVAAQAVG